MRTCKKLVLLLLAIVLAPASPGTAAESGKNTVKSKSPGVASKVDRETKAAAGASGTSRPAKKKVSGTARGLSSSEGQTPVASTEKKPSKSAAKNASRAKGVSRRGTGKKNSSLVASLPPAGGILDDNAIQGRISSRSAVVVDARTGETLYDQNGDTPRQPASTIKVLTGLLAIERLNDRDSVPTSPYAAGMPSSKVNLQTGKSYPANDIINAILLASANDASVAVAEKLAGSEDEFAQLMTARARKLGATNTQCRTASGLTAEGQYTTARDLALIFGKAMQNEEFAARMARVQAKTREGKVLKNHNKALWKMDCADGGKTGFTNAARQTYVGKFSRGSDELIVAIMGSESMWRDIRELVEYGFKKKRQVAVAATPAKKSHVEDQIAMLRMNLLREELAHRQQRETDASL